jgi:hypothetical protein
VLFQERDGIIFNAPYNDDGAIINKQACKPALKASCQSGSAIRIAPAASIIGSRSRTQPRQQ